MIRIIFFSIQKTKFLFRRTIVQRKNCMQNISSTIYLEQYCQQILSRAILNGFFSFPLLQSRNIIEAAKFRKKCGFYISNILPPVSFKKIYCAEYIENDMFVIIYKTLDSRYILYHPQQSIITFYLLPKLPTNNRLNINIIFMNMYSIHRLVLI